MTLHGVTSVSFSVNTGAGRHDPAPEFSHSIWRMRPSNPSTLAVHPVHSRCSPCAFQTKTCQPPLLLLGGQSVWLMKTALGQRGRGRGGCWGRWGTPVLRWDGFRQQYAEEPESDFAKQFLPWACRQVALVAPTAICHPEFPWPAGGDWWWHGGAYVPEGLCLLPPRPWAQESSSQTARISGSKSLALILVEAFLSHVKKKK